MPGTDDLSRITYCMNVYSKILQYADVGVGLTHISPLYLLNYQDYQTLYAWKQKKMPGAELLVGKCIFLELIDFVINVYITILSMIYLLNFLVRHKYYYVCLKYFENIF